MTIQEAIDGYLIFSREQGLQRSTIELRGAALRLVCKTLLGEELAILTHAQVAELRARLWRTAGAHASPLVVRTLERHWRTMREFVRWCFAERLLNKDPFGPRPVEHLGELVRRLRQDAGMSRRELARAIGLSLNTLGRFEIGRLRLTRAQLLRLLRHPCMARLPDRAKAAGLLLGLGNNGLGTKPGGRQ